MLGLIRTRGSSSIAVLVGFVGACSAGKTQVDGATPGYTKIDDMENGGNHTEWAAPGMGPGTWWSATGCTQYDDISPVSTAVNPGRWSFAVIPTPHETFPGVTSSHGAHLYTTAPLTSVWGAEMGFQFAEMSGSDAALSTVSGADGGILTDTFGCPVLLGWNYVMTDIRAYAGVTFWAKADPAGTQTIRVSMDDRNTDPRGGVCAGADVNDVTSCWNSFSTEIQLSDEFAQYTVDFSSLHQNATWAGYLSGDPVDLEHVFQLEFAVDLPVCTDSATSMCAGGSAVSFDFWVDDVYFVNKAAEQ